MQSRARRRQRDRDESEDFKVKNAAVNEKQGDNENDLSPHYNDTGIYWKNWIFNLKFKKTLKPAQVWIAVIGANNSCSLGWYPFGAN